MIIPISIVGNRSMQSCKDLLLNQSKFWISNYSGDTHPGTMFTGVQQNVSIIIHNRSKESIALTSNFIRFMDATGEREYLFTASLKYNIEQFQKDYFIKVGSVHQASVFNKLFKNRQSFKTYNHTKSNYIYYHDVVHYWVKAFIKPPYFKREVEPPSISSHYKYINCPDTLKVQSASVFCSSMFYLWYVSKSNGRDFSKDDFLEFPINLDELDKTSQISTKLGLFGTKYIESLENNKVRVEYLKKSGKVIYDQYWVEKSKDIANQIDTVLAQHYGFTEEELDFIINYDIKYRMGKELDAYIEGALGKENIKTM